MATAVLILATSLFSYLTAPRIPILGFHGIQGLNNPQPGMTQTPIAPKMSYPQAEIEKLLDYLVSHHYWFLSAQELYDFFIAETQEIPPEHLGQKPILLSFDDSYKSVYQNLVPIFEKLEAKYGQKAKAVLFVNPGTLAQPNKPSTTYLSCNDLRAGFQSGFYDIQSHGLNHKNLTQISPADLTTELAAAQTQLRACLAGIAPPDAIATHIAYPFGASNPQVEAATAHYYQSAFLYNSRILRFCHLKNHYALSRLSVNQAKSAQRLIEMAERSTVMQHQHPC